ncbi:MAG: hypothetical protein E6Q90_08955 [Actinobacteria bacterium]|nr:MAG: hypothetical protein E6Q90_08955 [Actinomycetota bacterium]
MSATHVWVLSGVVGLVLGVSGPGLADDAPAAPLSTWGYNDTGQLGTGNVGTDALSPTAVDHSGALAGKTASAISAGGQHTCAVVEGQAYCWGYNLDGTLGDGTTTDQPTPAAVDTSGVLNGRTVTDISAGGSHTCVIADGAAFCWGNNDSGEVGNGTSGNDVLSPAAVSLPSPVTDISAGRHYSCAVAAGTAYCWGLNLYSTLGDGTSTPRNAPVPVTAGGTLAGKTVTEVAAGYDHTCVLADGAPFCWGFNGDGQLGDGSKVTSAAVRPVDMTALAGKALTGLTAGDSYNCVIADGGLYCWGNNIYGQLGDGSQTVRDAPTAVTGITGSVTQVSAGAFHTCAVITGAAYCWGSNAEGELGDGAAPTWSTSPVAVSRTGPLQGATVVGIAAGAWHSAALIATPPAAPRDASAVAGDASARITWAPPVADGGSPVTGFMVRATPGGASCSTTGELTCSVAGLANGVPHTFAVVALNAFGQSRSISTAPVTPTGSTPAIVARTQSPRDAKGSPPKALKAKGLTVLTGRNARTNAGQLIATKVTVKTSSKVRAYRIIRGSKGKVAIRTYGKRLKVTLVHSAPATGDYLPYTKRTVYRVRP